MSNERCTIVGFNIGRPFDHSLFAPDLTPIYRPCHSRKSINRALISHKRETQARREGRGEGGSSSSTAAGPPSDHRRSTAGPPPDRCRNLAGPPPKPRRTTAGVSLHHCLKGFGTSPVDFSPRLSTADCALLQFVPRRDSILRSTPLPERSSLSGKTLAIRYSFFAPCPFEYALLFISRATCHSSMAETAARPFFLPAMRLLRLLSP
ncbi:hypothetical protein KFK09_010761 [Dendrobium nobile]|uniref:Uncharacterized protein n=1 Tax=Dendrobium nobile TaxID=94219 RepID=A0A8T3BDP1_DENNO|nr:hypothetical protein KFK09_010761 [Dendrobium nobile]